MNFRWFSTRLCKTGTGLLFLCLALKSCVRARTAKTSPNVAKKAGQASRFLDWAAIGKLRASINHSAKLISIYLNGVASSFANKYTLLPLALPSFQISNISSIFPLVLILLCGTRLHCLCKVVFYWPDSFVLVRFFCSSIVFSLSLWSIIFDFRASFECDCRPLIVGFVSLWTSVSFLSVRLHFIIYCPPLSWSDSLNIWLDNQMHMGSLYVSAFY